MPRKNALLPLLLLLPAVLMVGCPSPRTASPRSEPIGPPLPPLSSAAAQEKDPAKRVLLQTAAAYRALQSFSADVTTTVQVGSKTDSTTGSLAFSLPNQVRAISTETSSGAQHQAISDGKALYVVNSDDKQNYRKGEAPDGSLEIAQALMRGNRGAEEISILLAGRADLHELFFGRREPALAVSRQTFQGTEADIVTATIKDERGNEAHYEITIGSQDSLLRQIKMTTEDQGKPVKITRVYTNVQANPDLPPSLFAFTPPESTEEAPLLGPDDQFDPRLKVGAVPLAFSGTDLDGKPVTLAQYQGKVVLLDFWATWCGPCLGEMPNVINAYNAYRAQGFEVVGVSLDNAGQKEKLRAFVQRNGMSWRQVYEGKGWNSEQAKAYSLRSIPFMLLIGRDGKIAAVNARGEELAPAIEAALAASPSTFGP